MRSRLRAPDCTDSVSAEEVHVGWMPPGVLNDIPCRQPSLLCQTLFSLPSSVTSAVLRIAPVRTEAGSQFSFRAARVWLTLTSHRRRLYATQLRCTETRVSLMIYICISRESVTPMEGKSAV